MLYHNKFTYHSEPLGERIQLMLKFMSEKYRLKSFKNFSIIHENKIRSWIATRSLAMTLRRFGLLSQHYNVVKKSIDRLRIVSAMTINYAHYFGCLSANASAISCHSEHSKESISKALLSKKDSSVTLFPQNDVTRAASTLAEVFSSHPTSQRKYAFTLAEVLITLGIIGVIAAMTMPSLITRIQNKGYVEGLNKAYSVLQNVTNKIIDEESEPSNWILDANAFGSHEPNAKVVDMYAKNVNTALVCDMVDASTVERETPCILKSVDYHTLDGEEATFTSGIGFLYTFSYPILLQDGSSISLKFSNNPAGGFFWGYPDITFIVDVNGKKKPNKVGRDIFLLYLNKNSGKIFPFIDEKSAKGNLAVYADDCKDGRKGFSCAYKVITEGKMNY